MTEEQTAGLKIFGVRPVMEAMQAEKPILKIMLKEGAAETDLVKMIVRSAGIQNIPISRVPLERLERLSKGRNHQGVVAFMASAEFAEFDQVAEQIREEGINHLVLMLDKITDVRNFGAIARTAECAGVNALIVPAKGSASMGSDAMKTSAGALNHIPVCRVPNLKSVINTLKKDGVQIIAATEKATEYYFDIDFTKPTAIIMGSEEAGISKSNLELCDHCVKIPINGKIESLNVSAATSAILFEAVRQRVKKS